ncbi:MAG TPA: hypothetical protein VFW60_01780 [Rhodanobacteraceae bacterium]|nr:hypothetical protein [Rhodanobacteraceae bacterium]
MPNGKLHWSSGLRACAVIMTCAAALSLAACQHAQPPSNATPAKAIATNLRLTAMGDFDGLMKNRLPAVDYAQWREEWRKAHAHPVPASLAQQTQFAKIMRMLTAPGAEAELAKRLQPELTRLHGGQNPPMPILGGILEAAGKQMIAESPQLGPAQRALASRGLDAMIAWSKTTDLGDPNKAQKAINLICATARQLHVQTLQQWRMLDYAHSMRNYGIIWNGLESLLDIYGLDLAKSLTHADIDVAANDGVHATVKLDMRLAGKTIAGEWPMVKQDGHWYDAALLAAWHQAHPASSASIATPVAPASASGAATTPASNTPAPAATPSPSTAKQAVPASKHGTGS